ncbi:MAG: hypothetical protein RR014_07040, partial [Bilophila sp.]
MARSTLPRPTSTNIQGVIPPIEENWFAQYAPSVQQEQPEEEPGFWSQAWESGKALGEGLKFLPGDIVDTAQDAFSGFDPTDKEEMAQRAETEREKQAYHEKYEGKAAQGITDIEAAIGVRDKAPDLVESFNEVAPATFWQTTLMAGGKKGIDLAYNRYKNRGQNIEQELPQDLPADEMPKEEVPSPSWQPTAKGQYSLEQFPKHLPVPVGGQAIEPDAILFDEA